MDARLQMACDAALIEFYRDRHEADKQFLQRYITRIATLEEQNRILTRLVQVGEQSVDAPAPAPKTGVFPHIYAGPVSGAPVPSTPVPISSRRFTWKGPGVGI